VEWILSHTGTQVVFQLSAGFSADEYALEVRVLLQGNKSLKMGVLTDRLTI
jgi:hypothetical protein